MFRILIKLLWYSKS